MYLIKTMIIIICTVENIERARLIRYYIHSLDIVYLCFGYMYKGRHLSLYIIQRVDFDTSLMCAKGSPREYSFRHKSIVVESKAYTFPFSLNMSFTLFFLASLII